MNSVLPAILLITIGALAQSEPYGHTSEYPKPTIREEQNIMVDGLSETWRLQWHAAPTPYCEPSDVSLTCPCMGFAYGEGGDLFLVRLRKGIEIDRLHLTPLFTEEPSAVLQRWPADHKLDFDLTQRDDFSELVSKRPIVQVMHFADYDHDGRQTEFYLQTESLPCGKSAGVVIGVSKGNPRLHTFGTVSNPTKPLHLQKREWEALRDASSGPVTVMDWACGDHGSPTQTEVQLHWSTEGIDGIRSEYSCPSDNNARRLIQQKPL